MLRIPCLPKAHASARRERARSPAMAAAPLALVVGYLDPVEAAAARVCCRAWCEWVNHGIVGLRPSSLGSSETSPIKPRPGVAASHLLARASHISYGVPRDRDRHGVTPITLSAPVRWQPLLHLAEVARQLRSLELASEWDAWGSQLDLEHLCVLPALVALTVLDFPFDASMAMDAVGAATRLQRVRLQSSNVSSLTGGHRAGAAPYSQSAERAPVPCSTASAGTGRRLSLPGHAGMPAAGCCSGLALVLCGPPSRRGRAFMDGDHYYTVPALLSTFCHGCFAAG
jgi:hypothetical protein